jgi:hypothetical protein
LQRSAANLQMSVMLNGKERSTAEWQSVISAADPGLKLNKIISPIGSHFSAIEVIFHSSSE